MKGERGHATVLSFEELTELFAELRYPHNCIAELAYWTASRIGEILPLHSRAVVDRYLLIRQPKVQRVKRFPIEPPIQKILDRLPEGQWFPAGHQSTGRKPHISTQAFEKELHRALALLGWSNRGIRTHTFRRSQVTHLDEQGMPHKKIMLLSGHSTLSSFEEYLDADLASVGAFLRGLKNWQ